MVPRGVNREADVAVAQQEVGEFLWRAGAGPLATG
jgi:hypothetical protein